MTRFTPLERAVLEALADELRLELPDLPGQIAEALPGVRRNTGSGFSTEIIVDRNRPPPDGVLNGRVGTIHGDVPGLIEPMAFQIDVAAGRLLALHGATYDERTDGIDFPTARVSGLFRIDSDGASVAWSPSVLTDNNPLRALQRSDEPTAGQVEASVWDSMSPHIAQSRRLLEAERAPAAKAADVGMQALEALFGKRTDATDTPEATPEEQTSLVIGTVVILAVVALFAVVFFDVPLFFALIMLGYLAAALVRPKGRAALRKMIDLYKSVRASDRR